MNVDAIATIFYEEGGVEREWSIGAHLTEDNEETLRAHLAKWKPKAKFLRCEIQEVPNEKGPRATAPMGK